MTDYEDIRQMEAVLSQTRPDDFLRPVAFNDLAVALHARYDEAGNRKYIRCAVHNYDEPSRHCLPTLP